MLGVGLLLFVGGAVPFQMILRLMGDTDATDPLALWIHAHPNGMFLPMLLIFPGAIFASFAFLGLVGHAHPTLLTGERIGEIPSYGPSLKDFLLDRAGNHRRMELQEGVLYGYVDPDAQFHRL